MVRLHWNPFRGHITARHGILDRSCQHTTLMSFCRSCRTATRRPTTAFSQVYDELRRLAAGRLVMERPDHTLQPTALANEVYLKLIDQTRARFKDRSHFLAVASQAIRRILVDHARGHGRRKRGGDRARVAMEDATPIAPPASDLDVLALHEALQKLSQDAPDNARTVELRFFGGMTADEIAEVMNVSARTVERRWAHARAWLFREMSGQVQGDEDASE